jgi:hypothetical protein
MAYSLVRAAAATGVNRTTVLRAIKGGKLTAERDAQGAWQIEPCELHRVFPPLPATEPVQSPGQDGEVALLRTMLEELRATVADLRLREDDLKADRDHWREAQSATLRLLPKPMLEDALPAPGMNIGEGHPDVAEPPRPSGLRRRAWEWLKRN